jgi:flagellin-like hook-associated protein FlgL
MGQAVQRIQAADNGISTIRSFISAMKGVVNNALGNTDSNARADLGKQFNELINQIGTAAADSSYQGINLLQDSGATGESESVQFNETFDQSTLEVKGFSIEAGNYTSSTGNIEGIAQGDIAGITSIQISSGAVNGAQEAALVISTQDGIALGIQGYSASNTALGGTSAYNDWSDDTYDVDLKAVIGQLEAFDNQLKTQASALANNLSTITTREEFSTNMINTLTEGADKLTLADLNEEGANLLALQTQNQLATQSLSLASQQSQSVLQLIG